MKHRSNAVQPMQSSPVLTVWPDGVRGGPRVLAELGQPQAGDVLDAFHWPAMTREDDGDADDDDDGERSGVH